MREDSGSLLGWPPTHCQGKQSQKTNCFTPDQGFLTTRGQPEQVPATTGGAKGREGVKGSTKGQVPYSLSFHSSCDMPLVVLLFSLCSWGH